MKKVICNIEYDTDASELIMNKTYGNFGDPWGYEERLYKNAGGKYFVYCFGGFARSIRNRLFPFGNGVFSIFLRSDLLVSTFTMVMPLKSRLGWLATMT